MSSTKAFNETALVVKHYLQTRLHSRWRSRAAFEKWQERKIIQHIRRVRKLSPFYANLWAGIPDERFREFPIIDKSIMMANFNQLNTVQIDKDHAFSIALAAEQSRDFKPTLDGITIGLSSGTSGNRGLFIVSAQEQAAWTGTALAKLLPGALAKGGHIAFFLRANSNLYESVQRGKLSFRYYDLMMPLETHLATLHREQPNIWIAPPSMLRLLAQAKVDNRLRHLPQKIISVAEVLDPLDQQLIEQAFGQPVHQVYQCTEGFLAASNSQGKLILNEDLVHIDKEYLDEQRTRYIPIVTDFSRISQPIIRYRLNDILTEQQPPEDRLDARSKMRVLVRIEGRSDDMLFLQRQGEAGSVPTYAPIFPDFVTRAIISASDDIAQYIVVQTTPDNWTIQLQLSTMTNSQDEPERQVQQLVYIKIHELCKRLGCIPPKLTFEPYVQSVGTNKLRRVMQKTKKLYEDDMPKK